MNLTQTSDKLDIPRSSLQYWQRLGLLSCHQELKFLDLIKARFIGLCRRRGISLQSLRRVIGDALGTAWQEDLVLYGDYLLARREEEAILYADTEQLLLPFQKNKRQAPVEFKRRDVLETKKIKMLQRLGKRYEKAAKKGDELAIEGILVKTLKIDSEYTSGWLELGNLYFHQEKMKKAQQAYEKSLALAPDSTEVLYNLGNLHFKEARYAVAIRCFQKCLNINPDFIEVYYNFGLLFFQIAHFNVAIDMFEHYLTLDPSSTWSSQARQLIEDATSAMQEYQEQTED